MSTVPGNLSHSQFGMDNMGDASLVAALVPSRFSKLLAVLYFDVYVGGGWNL
jgi:hypothetical protein